jgi:hypothetical protein
LVSLRRFAGLRLGSRAGGSGNLSRYSAMALRMRLDAERFASARAAARTASSSSRGAQKGIVSIVCIGQLALLVLKRAAIKHRQPNDVTATKSAIYLQ